MKKLLYCTLLAGLSAAVSCNEAIYENGSYSMSYMQTEAVKTSLMCKANAKGEIVQDTGTGGAWPTFSPLS